MPLHLFLKGAEAIAISEAMERDGEERRSREGWAWRADGERQGSRRGGAGRGTHTHTYAAAPQIKMREDRASSKENEDVIDRSLSSLFTRFSVPPAISGPARLHTSKA